MKSKIFKFILQAFALILAVTAALAFTPAENNLEDDMLLDVSYINSQSVCVDLASQVDCALTGCLPCTINIGSNTFILYLHPDDPNAPALEVTTKCTHELKKVGS